MAKLITNTHNAVEIYFESGSARIRLKKPENLEGLARFNREYPQDSMRHYSNK